MASSPRRFRVFPIERFWLRALPCLLSAIFLLGLTAPLAAQRGGMTKPMNLNELVDGAGVIVHGHIASVVAEPHPTYRSLNTLLITIRVSESLKGNVGATYTYRQYVWDVRDIYDSAGYKRGQEVLMFLTAPSEVGLSSPVGLQQGVFHVRRDAQGRATVSGRSMLFERLEPQLQQKGVRLPDRLASMVANPPRGPMPLDDMRELIRGLAGASR